MRDFSKLKYLIKLSQYFGNLAKAVMRSHSKKLLNKVSKILIENSEVFNVLKVLIYVLPELN